MKKILDVYRAVPAHMPDLMTFRAIPTPRIEHLDPFLFINHHGPEVYKPGNRGLPFGPHPHRGFETLTFIFDGDIVHWDSNGFKSTIHEGGVQWMTAGSGLIHSEQSSEKFQEEGGPVEIIQLWMNLPASHKMIPPDYHGFEKEQLIKITDEDRKNEVHLISGTYAGKSGPMQSLTGLTMMTVDIDAEGSFQIEIPAACETLFYVVRGSVSVNGKEARMHDLVRFNHDEGSIAVSAAKDAKLIVGYGKPFNEPIVAQGPFVMNSESEIREAFMDYQQGKLGTW
jgi:hypothetical protein